MTVEKLAAYLAGLKGEDRQKPVIAQAGHTDFRDITYA